MNSETFGLVREDFNEAFINETVLYFVFISLYYYIYINS